MQKRRTAWLRHFVALEIHLRNARDNGIRNAQRDCGLFQCK